MVREAYWPLGLEEKGKNFLKDLKRPGPPTCHSFHFVKMIKRASCTTYGRTYWERNFMTNIQLFSVENRFSGHPTHLEARLQSFKYKRSKIKKEASSRKIDMLFSATWLPVLRG